jgi:hypothetical protein
VADRLWNDDAVRSTVASTAVKATETPGDQSGRTVQDAASELDSLKLPIGWSSANDDIGWSDLSGWLITFIAVSFGAPFWFDALSRLARLRTTGAKPETTRDTRTS